LGANQVSASLIDRGKIDLTGHRPGHRIRAQQIGRTGLRVSGLGAIQIGSEKSGAPLRKQFIDAGRVHGIRMDESRGTERQ